MALGLARPCWLAESALRTNQHNSAVERVLFVNAWNEWAEGAYLEPDRRFGYTYLHATSSVLRQFRKKDPAVEQMLASSRNTFSKKASAARVVHLFYRDLLDELCALIGNATVPVDLLITISDDAPVEWVSELRAKLPEAYLQAVPNRGRDILPFFQLLSVVQQFGYTMASKLHSKKSPHSAHGEDWRALLWQGLFSPKAAAVATRAFEADQSIGLIAPADALTDLSQRDVHADNRLWLDRLLKQIDPRHATGDYNLLFPAGSMFWFRPNAVPTLSDLGISAVDFEVELGQVDGTLAHALERLFAFGVTSRRYKVADIASLKG